MARVARILLVIVLIAFSSLVSWNSDATSGSLPLLYASHELQAVDDINQIKDAGNEEVEFINRRVDFQNNDYPGAGANNHHMPKPPTAGD